MAAHVEEFVFDVVGGIVLELGDLAFKALPLGEGVVRVGWVGAV